jgi:hypothetical protein
MLNAAAPDDALKRQREFLPDSPALESKAETKLQFAWRE